MGIIKMKNLLMLLALSLILCSCATTPIRLQEATAVPAARIYFNKKPSTANPARAIFVRDVGFTGRGVYQHVYINGERAASLAVGERFDVHLDPGDYIFGVMPTDPFGSHAMYSIDQTLIADKSYFYRILIDGNSMTSRIHRYVPGSPGNP